MDRSRKRGRTHFLRKGVHPLSAPTEAAAVAVVYALIVTPFFYHEPSRRELPRIFVSPLAGAEGRLTSFAKILSPLDPHLCARGGRSRFQAYCAWMRPRSGDASPRLPACLCAQPLNGFRQ